MDDAHLCRMLLGTHLCRSYMLRTYAAVPVLFIMMVIMELRIKSPNARIPVQLGYSAHLYSSDMVPTYAAKYPTCFFVMIVIMAL
jgi:hypothetical protein